MSRRPQLTIPRSTERDTHVRECGRSTRRVLKAFRSCDVCAMFRDFTEDSTAVRGLTPLLEDPDSNVRASRMVDHGAVGDIDDDLD
jgi:hypothetical protein